MRARALSCLALVATTGCGISFAQRGASTTSAESAIEESTPETPTIGKLPRGHYIWNEEARTYVIQRDPATGDFADHCLEYQTGRQMKGQPEGVWLCTYDPEPPPAEMRCEAPLVKRRLATGSICVAGCGPREVATIVNGEWICQNDD